jgi:hypothetical protein
MWLLFSRIVLTIPLLGIGFLIWTNNVDLMAWVKRIKQRLPIAEVESKGLLRVSYQGDQNGIIAVVFKNYGSAPITYFTAQIRAKSGVFEVKDISADFSLSVPPGKGGSWIVISGREMLPGNYGAVTLRPQSANLVLEQPEVTSDSPHEFIGQWTVKFGPEERSED